MVFLGNKLLKYNETKICDKHNVFFYSSSRREAHFFAQWFCLQIVKETG